MHIRRIEALQAPAERHGQFADGLDIGGDGDVSEVVFRGIAVPIAILGALKEQLSKEYEPRLVQEGAVKDESAVLRRQPLPVTSRIGATRSPVR